MGDIEKEIKLAKSLVSSAGPVNIMIIHRIFIFCYSDPFLRAGKFFNQPVHKFTAKTAAGLGTQAISLVSPAGPVNIMIIHHIFIFCFSDPFLGQEIFTSTSA